MEATPVGLVAPGAPLRPGSVETDDLTGAARSLIETAGWAFTVNGPWAYGSPPGATLPEQGWKLHISATDESADAVLAAVAPVLIAAGAPFKLAASRRVLGMLTATTADRASAGKFVTVYPLSDAMATAVAGACHQATAGLAGPVILSDRPYRPGSLVHYRYGGFVDRQAIDSDGVVLHLIRTPAGDLVPDERKAAYAAPAWAIDPFTDAGAAPDATSAAAPARPAGAVLLNDRYTVVAALRHANKGGTYLAEDRLEGVHVVIKEGRPHVAAGSPGGDARDRVRHEGAMLARLAPTGRVPGVVELFEQQGHVFLVMDHVPDPTVRELVDDAFEPPASGLDEEQLTTLATNLARAVADVHAAGVVLRDLNPNNVLVAPDGEITLIDLEMAQLVGTSVTGGSGTPGYGSPEQLQGGRASFSDDAWSLGATLAFAASATDPFLPATATASWTDPPRLREWMARMVVSRQVEPHLARLVLAAMAERPEERLGPDGLAVALLPGRSGRRQRDNARRPTMRRGGRPADTRLGLELDLDAVGPADVPDAVAGWLIENLGAGTGGHLWPAGPTSAPLDPLNVQAGASGVGLFLCQLAGSSVDPRVRQAVSDTADWVCDRLSAGPARPPGLHFGLSGPIWFLTRAAAILDRDDLLRRANELALSLPVHCPLADFTHGTAGVGLGQLHQWSRTGDDRFLARAVLAADHLVRTVERDADGTAVWPVPADSPSRLAGTTSYGFAHGTAGVAAFLLTAGAATGEESYLRTACDALDGLLDLAVGTDDGAAYWPMAPDDDTLWAHWCNGSSGVGSAMIRGYTITGDPRYRAAAEAAALAGWRERWRSSTTQCHGLAGNAEFFLDLHQATGDVRYRSLAAEAAEVMLLQRRRDSGHTVFADDTGGGLSAAYGTGMAGLASFFLRLTGGGRRLLMLDGLMGARR